MAELNLALLKSLMNLGQNELLIELSKLKYAELPTRLKKTFIDLISNQMSKGRFGRAFNGISIWMHFVSPVEEESFSILSRLALYPIENGANTKFIAFLERLANAAKSDYKPEWHRKFVSIFNYANLWAQLAHEEQTFFERIKKSKTQLFKSYLAHTEQLFLEHNMKREVRKRMSGYATRTKESFASTASLLLRRYGMKAGLRSKHLSSPIHNFSPREIEEVFDFLNGIVHLIEFGIRIVHLDFDCTESGGRYQFTAADRITDMALSYGYVRNEFANLTFASKQTAASTRFRDAAGEYLKRWGSTVKVVGEGVSRRIRIETPMPLIKTICSEVLLRDVVFGDEERALELACADFYASPQHILKFEIMPNLSIMDTLKIIRIVRFLSYLRDPKLIELEAYEPLAALNSMTILHTPKKQFIEHLLEFGVQLGTAEDFLQHFSFNLDDPGSGQMFDLQYQPIISDEAGLLLLPNVMAHSNLFRNVLIRSKKRFVGGDNKARLEEILELSLKKWTNKIKTDVSFKFRGLDGEIDLIFEFGDTIFVFECKDLLLPCNAFEQRSYIEQIHKGTRQVLRVAELLRDGNFLEYLSKKLGWDLHPKAKILPAVITGGRLFSGANINGVPVRNLKEIINLIETGKVYIGPSRGDFEEIALWSGKDLSPSDIESYLSESSILYAPVWKNASVEEVNMGFTSVFATFEMYGFDLLKNARDLGVSEGTLNKITKSYEE